MQQAYLLRPKLGASFTLPEAVFAFRTYVSCLLSAVISHCIAGSVGLPGSEINSKIGFDWTSNDKSCITSSNSGCLDAILLPSNSAVSLHPRGYICKHY